MVKRGERRGGLQVGGPEWSLTGGGGKVRTGVGGGGYCNSF